MKRSVYRLAAFTLVVSLNIAAVFFWYDANPLAFLTGPFNSVFRWSCPSIVPIVLIPRLIFLLLYMWCIILIIWYLKRLIKGEAVVELISNKFLLTLAVLLLVPILNRLMLSSVIPLFLQFGSYKVVVLDYWYIYFLILIVYLALSFLYRWEPTIFLPIIVGAYGPLILERSIWSGDVPWQMNCSLEFLRAFQADLLPIILCLMLWLVGIIVIRKERRT